MQTVAVPFGRLWRGEKTFMDNIFLKNIQKKVSKWRDDNYKGVKKETLNILSHIKRVGFLYEPQREAFETYIYLKEIAGNKSSLEIFKTFFNGEKEMILGLGVPKDEAFDLIGDKKKIKKLMEEKFGVSNYPNQVYALTMGAGKTILMAVMLAYDFTLSFYYPKDKRFAKNALVFAPDTTIIESLKEIKIFDYSKVLPKEYENIALNIKFHYLENVKTPITPIGNYNVIVSNSQKIILKTQKNGQNGLFSDMNKMEKREVENKRLYAIRQLKDLAIFVDEAHHSYGATLEGALKKVRATIDYLHKHKPLINVINLTGTPYIKNKMIADVVYYFGLKTGIEKGILKQVRFSEYSNVRAEKFIEEAVDNFLSEYNETRLEGRLPKIAIYAPSIEDLRKDLKPKLEKILSDRNINLDKILEYHTEAENNKNDFLEIDTPQSNKQFILLVGKGTEGWNCRSLVSCALYRKPKSAIFVLQSTTRCLRSIGDNSTIAHIFLSEENYKILDKELKNNFAVNIEELSAQDQKSVEHTLKVEKKRKIKVKKILKEILAVENKNIDKIKIDLKKFKREDFQAFISEGGIFLEQGEAGYNEARAVKKMEERMNLTYYEILEAINRYTHLPCLTIEKILNNNCLDRKKLTKKINSNLALLTFIAENILENAFEYHEKSEVVEEELELTKLYPFKISVEKGRDILAVYREQLEKSGSKSKIGFHINPYNFDSADEKDLFKYLRDVLDKDETVKDVYFTGGVSDPSHNDFYFEYFSPDKQRAAKYFPDFLIETCKGRFLVIEVKAGRAKENYQANKNKHKGKASELFDEVFAKEVGFNQFKEINKNFEYKIIFDAALRKRQKELLDKIKSL